MENNAYILDWAMNQYSDLKEELESAHFKYEKEKDKEHIRVSVPYEKVNMFAEIAQKHLNAPQNYIDIQFPENKTTILIFRDRKFIITKPEENEEAKKWALSVGLPIEQSDWSVSR